MTSLLKPLYTLRTGSQEWTKQVVRSRVWLNAAPRVDLAAFVFPAIVPLEAGPGDEVVLTLDSGERAAAVFGGVIDAVRRSPETTVVSAVNAGGVLARLRPSVTFQQITAGDVIKRLCDEGRVESGDVEDGVSLAYYVADPGQTAWQHAARVGAWSGALVSVSAGNRVNATVVDAEHADLAMRYGREVLDFAFDSQQSYLDTFATAGESGVGDASADDALRLTADFFAGNRPSGPGPRSAWRSVPALRTAQAAATAAAARQRVYQSTRDSGRLVAFLQPHIRPGHVIEVQGLPDDSLVQPLWVRRVEHTLSAAGAITHIDVARGGDRFDPLALLGSLAGAAGGAL